MTFPIWWDSHKSPWFQTTNQHIITECWPISTGGPRLIPRFQWCENVQPCSSECLYLGFEPPISKKKCVNQNHNLKIVKNLLKLPNNWGFLVVLTPVKMLVSHENHILVNLGSSSQKYQPSLYKHGMEHENWFTPPFWVQSSLAATCWTQFSSKPKSSELHSRGWKSLLLRWTALSRTGFSFWTLLHFSLLVRFSLLSLELFKAPYPTQHKKNSSKQSSHCTTAVSIPMYSPGKKKITKVLPGF